MDPTISLDYRDFMIASQQAAMMTAAACRRGMHSGRADHGSTSLRKVGQRLGDRVVGELGELALAKHLRLPKTSTDNPFATGDVASGFEVRTTEHPNGHLLVYDSDPDARFFLAVVEFDQRQISVSLPGWIMANDARVDRFWGDGDPPCYWIPQNELEPITPHN